ncbi:LPS export ABC transporter permease LptF [Geovibrio sp. ADMFC3]
MQMNTLQKYIIREIVPLFVFGNVLFVVFLLLEKLINLADLFFTKNVPALLIAETIIYYLPSFLMITIPTSALMASMVGFGRLSADSEITVMKAAGAGGRFFLKPAVIVGIGAFALSMFMSVYLMPLGSTLAINNLARIAKSISVKDMKENEMYDEIPGLLFYADKRPDDNEFGKIVVIDKNTGTIITAETGAIVPSGESALVMNFNNGRVVAETAGEQRTVVRFGEMAMNLPFELKDKFSKRDEYFMTMFELAENFDDHVNYKFEFSKRFALPVAGLLMGILGMSLGIFFHRSGRSIGIPLSLGLTLFYYMIFFTSLNLARAGVLDGFFAPWLANIFFTLVTALFAYRVLK